MDYYYFYKIIGWANKCLATECLAAQFLATQCLMNPVPRVNQGLVVPECLVTQSPWFFGFYCGGVIIGQIRLGQVKVATALIYGGVCIGQVRLGQVRWLLCSSLYYLLSITLVRAWKSYLVLKTFFKPTEHWVLLGTGSLGTLGTESQHKSIYMLGTQMTSPRKICFTKSCLPFVFLPYFL